MDYHIDKECSALGGLFQTIITDMKTQAPIWEDFCNKASKLHSTLRTTIVAIGAFLEAFQKVADMATNTRGATREIGSALTRLCMRHRSIEQKLKIFTSSILDMCVNPLQERMEEWKKTVVQLDKDHAKEYKKARTEIKKASSDTMRLKKKVRKGKNDMQGKLDSALQEVNDKFMVLEETEKNAVRTALIEERNRFCLFISCLKPVVDEEIAMLTEITHLQEVIDALCMQAGDPYSLPPASEQVIRDLKLADHNSWSFQVTKTPPSSPSSIGSRKSSMCSISSINSSSSGSTKSHSPSHHLRHRATSQILEVQLNTKPPLPGTIRLSSVSSQDSGFTSQDTLFLKNPTPPPLDIDAKNSVHDAGSGGSTGSDSNASTPSPSHYSGPPSTSASTWSNWPDPPHVQARPDPIGLPPFDRPHTISTAYERHARPALTASTFEPPDASSGHLDARPTSVHSATAPSTPSLYAVPSLLGSSHTQIQQHQHQMIQQQMQQQMKRESASAAMASPYAVPCIVPQNQNRRDSKNMGPPPPVLGPKPRVRPVAPPVVPDFSNNQPDQIYLPTQIPQPVYVNMNELATMAVAKQKEVEEHRRALQKKGAEEQVEEEHEEEGSGGQQPQPQPQQQGKPPDPNPYARPSFAHCQRSISMPAQDTSVHPMSKAIEELNQRTAAIRNQSPHRGASPARRQLAGVPKDGTNPEPKNQEGRELADAIKELEASTAALQLAYDGGQGTPGVRHSVAVTGYGPSPPGDDDGDELSLPPYPVVPQNPPGYDQHAPRQASTPRIAFIGRSQSFRLPPSQHYRAGYPAGPVGNTATLRRGSLPSKPPAPVRRTSSISSGMSVAPPVVPGQQQPPPGGATQHHQQQQRERSGSKTPTPQGTPTRHRRTNSEVGGMCADRPPDPSVRHSFAAPPSPRICDSDDDEDDSDDGAWPPPPPVDFMSPGEIKEQAAQAAAAAGAGERRGPRGSITDTHSGLMHHLDQMFRNAPVLVQHAAAPPCGARIWHPDSLPLQSVNRHERALSTSSDDITPTAEAPPGNNLMNQIKRGVLLRHTTSNDRSAPRLPQR